MGFLDNDNDNVMCFFVKYLRISKECCTFTIPEPPSLSTMLKSGIVLFLYPMGIHFDKTYTSSTDIVGILKERGLEISNPNVRDITSAISVIIGPSA